MSFSNISEFVDDGQICWKDSPKAFPVQVERALIKNNICAKLIRDMDQEKVTPKKPEDSPLVFRSRTLLPMKKISDEKLDDFRESPKSRARRVLRLISRPNGETREITKENFENNKNEKKDEAQRLISPTNFQSQLNGEIIDTVSQSTFMTGLLMSGRFTSTPKIASKNISKKLTEQHMFIQDDEEIFVEDGTLKKICHRESLVHSSEERMKTISQESLNENYVSKKIQEFKKSSVQNICTPFQKLTCIKKQIDNCNAHDSNRIANNCNKDCCKQETIKISLVPSSNKLTNDQNKNISPQQVNFTGKDLDGIDDDFYSDDTSGFASNSGKSVKSSNDLSQKNRCSLSSIIEIQTRHSNVNMYNIKEEILAKGIKDDLIKDDFYDDSGDNFFDSINESVFLIKEVGESIENISKRKFDSSSITDQSTNIKKPHLEVNDDPIEDDFYDDDVDFKF
uniref:DNA helicase n=1 Tax=Strongyloides venezuelensis TaxID=75913 RepID=A0A0K0FEJ7_STRVS